jgi:hypothetical protein
LRVALAQLTFRLERRQQRFIFRISLSPLRGCL